MTVKFMKYFSDKNQIERLMENIANAITRLAIVYKEKYAMVGFYKIFILLNCLLSMWLDHIYPVSKFHFRGP